MRVLAILSVSNSRLNTQGDRLSGLMRAATGALILLAYG